MRGHRVLRLADEHIRIPYQDAPKEKWIGSGGNVVKVAMIRYQKLSLYCQGLLRFLGKLSFGLYI